jgi:hypothetical protein
MGLAFQRLDNYENASAYLSTGWQKAFMFSECTTLALKVGASPTPPSPPCSPSPPSLTFSFVNKDHRFICSASPIQVSFLSFCPDTQTCQQTTESRSPQPGPGHGRQRRGRKQDKELRCDVASASETTAPNTRKPPFADILYGGFELGFS